MPEMTDLERGQIIREWISLLQQQVQSSNLELTIFFTLLFGYLLVAYFAGKNLQKREIVVLTSLYIVAISRAAFSLTIGRIGGVGLHNGLTNICPECGISPLISVESVMVFAVVNFAMVCASLYFMWSVRHPKTE